MDEAGRLKYETQSKDLRLQLKTWELDFAKGHNGSKPGRDHIKANPKIASMYKNYNKLRDILSGKVPPPQSPQPPPPSKHNDNHHDHDADDNNRKRKPHNSHTITPSSKRFRPAETPSRTPYSNVNITTTTLTPAAAAAAVTPSLSRQLFSPPMPTSIGPTPQRDGRVLGLFDFLPFKDAEVESPSKPNRSTRTTTTTSQQRSGAAVLHETPRKGKYTMDTGLGIEVDLTRTPSSSRVQRSQQTPRRGLPATPSRRQHHDGDNDDDHGGPTNNNKTARTPGSAHSASRLQFQTPSFLRRIPMPSITEHPAGFPSPEPIRLPRRKPVVRGLSSILADLRRAEEERLDDDLDALREVEAEGEGDAATSTRPPQADSPSSNKNNNNNNNTAQRAPAHARTPAQVPKQTRDDHDVDSILAEDSQKQNMTLLGGFDDEATYDSQDDDGQEGVDRGGRPLRVYKKKGQKRTTRRANMRPVRTARPAAPAPGGGGDNNDDEDDDGGVIPETQVHAPRSTTLKTRKQPSQKQQDDVNDNDNSDSHSGSEYDDDDDADELAQDHSKVPKRAAVGKPGGDKEAKAKAKKAPRKVNELAHANFKRLKLRNSGAKGGAGFNSRFRRRR